jgi:hypothetical protein
MVGHRGDGLIAAVNTASGIDDKQQRQGSGSIDPRVCSHGAMQERS